MGTKEKQGVKLRHIKEKILIEVKKLSIEELKSVLCGIIDKIEN